MWNLEPGPPAVRLRTQARSSARAGERIGRRHLRRLEETRNALGDRAPSASLLLFGADFTKDLLSAAEDRADVTLVGLERLYGTE